MDWAALRDQFGLIAQAMDGTGGFRPRMGGTSHLIRHQREDDVKFQARNRRAVYENHLRQACDRFSSFLGRKRPTRSGTDAPLVRSMIENADLLGNDLDSFWRQFAQQAVARGSMLLVIDRLPVDAAPTLSEQQRMRALPYIRGAFPEDVVSFRVDPYSGAFESITLAGTEWIDGEWLSAERDYTPTDWRLRVHRRSASSGAPSEWETIAGGPHGFGACPVLAFTEDGSPFPCVGRFAQIADLSIDLFNLESEQREILSSQTFSVLTMKVPFTEQNMFDAKKTVAVLGTHSMLIYGDERPDFIAPDGGPADTYTAKISAVREQIARIAMDDTLAFTAQAESGLSRRLRFDALNAALTRFSRNLVSLERRMWALFHHALGTQNRVGIEPPTDFNLVDTAAELDILSLMQATGFSAAVQSAKRAAIIGSEFDGLADADVAALLAAEAEQVQEEITPQAQDDGAP